MAITASVATAESKGTFSLKVDKGRTFLTKEFDSTQEVSDLRQSRRLGIA